jgi:hypothetical protein
LEHERAASPTCWPRTTSGRGEDARLLKLTGQLAGLRAADQPLPGEFWALIFDCGGSDAQLAKAKGAPVDQVVATDFVQMRFFYMGVPKNSASPNAAKAFIAFMMTPEGQKLAWDTWAEDAHLRVEHP